MKHWQAKAEEAQGMRAARSLAREYERLVRRTHGGAVVTAISRGRLGVTHEGATRFLDIAEARRELADATPDVTMRAAGEREDVD